MPPASLHLDGGELAGFPDVDDLRAVCAARCTTRTVVLVPAMPAWSSTTTVPGGKHATVEAGHERRVFPSGRW